MEIWHITFAVGPDLHGRGEPVVRARTAAVGVGVQVGVPSQELTFALGWTPSGLRKARRRPCPETDRRAVLLRLALEERSSSDSPGERDQVRG